MPNFIFLVPVSLVQPAPSPSQAPSCASPDRPAPTSQAQARPSASPARARCRQTAQSATARGHTMKTSTSARASSAPPSPASARATAACATPASSLPLAWRVCAAATPAISVCSVPGSDPLCCQPCPPGSYASPSNVCAQCAVGKFQAREGQSARGGHDAWCCCMRVCKPVRFTRPSYRAVFVLPR